MLNFQRAYFLLFFNHLP